MFNRTNAMLCTLLLSAAPALSHAQGIGLPPLFDPADAVRHTLQFEGAAVSRGAASYNGSVGIRLRRHMLPFAVSGGLGLLSDGDFGFTAALSGQFDAGEWIFVDGAEKAFSLTAGSVVDANVRSADALGRAYTLSGGIAVAAVAMIPGLAFELSATPRYELRRLSDSGISDNDDSVGAQLGLTLGVAQFVQLIFVGDWVNRGVRAPNLPADGGWSFGATLRTRLPG